MAPPTKKHAASPGDSSLETFALSGGFRVLPAKFSESSDSCHFLYIKEHKVRDGSDTSRPTDKTLFVLNVPPYGTQESLKTAFSRCGAVRGVYLQQKPGALPAKSTPPSKFFDIHCTKGFKVAYVVFKNPQGLINAMNLPTIEPFVFSTQKCPISVGIKKWAEEYRSALVNPTDLQKDVDAFMQLHDKKLEKEDAAAEADAGVPDEEGWIKVTHKGRKPGLRRTETVSNRIMERERRKRERKELLNFYTWQQRESKREHIAQLRRRFEEDKQKIALMKAQRKFRPY